MNRDEERALVEAIEADIDNPAAWEDDRAPDPATPLGSVISIRLDPEMHQRLRDHATSQGIGYSALVRRWIEEQLSATPPDLARAIQLINDSFRTVDWSSMKPPHGGHQPTVPQGSD